MQSSLQFNTSSLKGMGNYLFTQKERKKKNGKLEQILACIWLLQGECTHLLVESLAQTCPHCNVTFSLCMMQNIYC